MKTLKITISNSYAKIDEPLQYFDNLLANCPKLRYLAINVDLSESHLDSLMHILNRIKTQLWELSVTLRFSRYIIERKEDSIIIKDRIIDIRDLLHLVVIPLVFNPALRIKRLKLDLSNHLDQFMDLNNLNCEHAVSDSLELLSVSMVKVSS